MKPLFIIGFMASGKTTFGRALARRLNKEFIDLDFYIEQRFRKTIKEIFSSEGEDAFRIKEREMLHEVGEFQDVIIACGGGTPCFFDNISYMNNAGITIMLDASIERITERLVINNAKRPLMAAKSPQQIAIDVKAGLQQREPFYAQAAIRFSGECLEDSRQINSTVDNFILQYPHFAI